MTQSINSELVESMRNGYGYLRAFTAVGSYPVLYLDGQDSVLCAECANDEDSDIFGGVQSCGVNWEDASLYCDQCSERIESAYAEPDED